MNALQGVRVLDLSRVLAGPWCTQNLADLGADVIKIERPGSGDDTRRWGPPFLADPQGLSTEESAYFLACNRNKRSVCCDLALPQGQDLIRALVPHCDVLVENFKVGDMARYGLDFESLIALNPRLVYCSITGFGQTGPYRSRPGYDFAIQALGGLMSVTGESDAEGGSPQKVGVAVADLFTGMVANVAILAALRHAERSGQGQHIDTALLDAQVAMLANLGASYLLSGQTPQRAGNAHPTIVPYQTFEVAPLPQGQRTHIVLAVGNDTQFTRFCTVAGVPHLADDPRFATNPARVQHRDALLQVLRPLLRQRSKADWLQALQAAQVPCGPINTLDEVFADPQVQARALVQTWAHPLHNALPLVASPFKLSATPVRSERPPPTLGQHTDAVLQELLNCDARQLAAWRASGVIA